MEYKLTIKPMNRTEIKRLVYWERLHQPNCRPGQAFCNKYLKPECTWPELYNTTEKGKAEKLIQEHMLEYQLSQLE